jgi:hypothetical protein
LVIVKIPGMTNEGGGIIGKGKKGGRLNEEYRGLRYAEWMNGRGGYNPRNNDPPLHPPTPLDEGSWLQESMVKLQKKKKVRQPDYVYFLDIEFILTIRLNHAEKSHQHH